MKIPEPADLQRWSDEVARNPRSLAFLPLARAYRRRGLRDAAMQLCLRGLEHHPANVDAHSLLALLYLERGEREKAADEWSMVLRVDPDSFEALRGMGFCYLEQDQLSRARQMLERAAVLRPADPTVQGALELLRGQEGRQAAADPVLSDDPWSAGSGSSTRTQEERDPWLPDPAPADTPDGDATTSFTGSPADEVGAVDLDPWSAGAAATEDVVARLPPTARREGGAAGRAAGGAPASSGTWQGEHVARDPATLFDELLGPGPLLGVLLVDGQGLVHAGRMTEAVTGDAVVLGAVLGGAIGEAARTAAHLSLGEWRGMQLDAEHALLHLAPAGADAVVLLATRRNAPAGWILRSAAHAAELAARYLEAYT